MNSQIDHKFDALFQPLKIGSMTVPNRIVLCAMGGTGLIVDGKFNDNCKDFFLNCAKNGVGMIVPGLSPLTDKWGRPGYLDDYKDAFLGPMKEFLAEFHETTDAKLVMQLGAGFGRGLRANFALKLPYFNYQKAMTAPSEMPNVFDPSLMHRALTKDEIHKLVDVMIHSAVLAKEAGCDGVELHAIHEGYLLDQFSIANYNHRTDEYGGSLDNRLRISLEMIRGIKEACGEDFPVLMRYSVVSKTAGLNKSVLPGQDYVEWGRNMEESISVVHRLEEAGLDALDTDNGTFDSWHWCHPPMYMPDACNLPEAEYIKNFCKIPVIVSGKMGNPDIALKAVKNELVDAVGLARPLLADNEWVKKVREGRIDDIRPCICCHNGCFGRLTTGKNVSCALNPYSLQEKKYKIVPAKESKNVLIVGGGVAGMEAARVSALRGLKPEIYEKTNRLGGAFISAASMDFKEEDKKLLRWYAKQMKDLNIPIHFNTLVDEELIKKAKPDVVIFAIGGAKKHLPVPGIETNKVADAKDYLIGKQELVDNTVIIGGGLTGCEVAYSIAKEGKHVAIVEMQHDIMNIADLCKVNSQMMRDLLKFHNVDVYTDASVLSATPNSVNIHQGDKDLQLPADQIIVSIGYKGQKLAGDYSGIKTYEIGDCVKLGNLLHCIWEANEVVDSL